MYMMRMVFGMLLAYVLWTIIHVVVVFSQTQRVNVHLLVVWKNVQIKRR